MWCTKYRVFFFWYDGSNTWPTFMQNFTQLGFRAKRNLWQMIFLGLVSGGLNCTEASKFLRRRINQICRCISLANFHILFRLSRRQCLFTSPPSLASSLGLPSPFFLLLSLLSLLSGDWFMLNGYDNDKDKVKDKERNYDNEKYVSGKRRTGPHT